MDQHSKGLGRQMRLKVKDPQLGYSLGIKMSNNETYDKMVKGMCFSVNTSIGSTFA